MTTMRDLFSPWRPLDVALPDLDNDFPFESALEERLIKVQRHPTLPLAIANYTPLAQYGQRWNEVTLKCRGLIWNTETDEVVARSFEKFFNWDDSTQPYPPQGPVLRSPKMDGSLGILYPDPSVDASATGSGPYRWHVATRGSFASDQALWATKFLHQMDGLTWDLSDLGGLGELKDSKSYLVEIIYPDNRIVVDYGGQERLTLLDVLDTATGKSDLEEFDRVYWLDKVDRVLVPGGFKDTMASDIPEGEEGFVFYWPEKDYRVKMKAAEYLELHRMIFSLSERSIWERLGAGESLTEIATKLPDEFHPWVRQVAERLMRTADETYLEVKREYNRLAKSMLITDTRREFAAKAVKSPNRAYLFLFYDGKGASVKDSIWKSLRPEGGKTVTTISEDVA